MPKTVEPGWWSMIPFALLLLSMAAGPLWFPRAWARHYFKVALLLGAVVVAYYVLGRGDAAAILEKGSEYFSFITLIGSLYVVSGGIQLQIPGGASPAANVLFLLGGGVLANVLGTTGASMLLFRPWLRMNQPRTAKHHVVFFIFIVSNVGGCLSPIGDPPLFLGFLVGVPFWWVLQNCWPMWTVAMSVLLAIFFWVDRTSRRGGAAENGVSRGTWELRGLLNLVFLAVILAALFLRKPLFLREALMMGAAAASYWLTPRSVHEANQFDLHPLREVAVLFAGIFACMIPVLEWLAFHAPASGALAPGTAYFGCGILSSVLDNAPTYLGFLQVAQSGAGHISIPAVVDKFPALLLAISVGSVFFGACTYVGNGPNLMLKSIAERQGVATPGFFGYLFYYTLPFLLPVLLLVGWLFFRG